MKNLKKLVCLVSSLLLVVTFAACSEEKDQSESVDKTQSDSSAGDIVVQPESDDLENVISSYPDGEMPETSAEQSGDVQEENTGKYSDVEIYTNAADNPAAKTESGVEVELTSENFEALMNEYMTIQGSGSEREKELLDQLQLFFDNMGDPAIIE